MLMALWGRFPFSVNTAAFQELQRSTSWRWPSQDVFGQMPTSQFVGAGEETITLPGVIFPAFKSGGKQIEEMRDQASNGRAELLLDGRGNILGRWAAVSITETQSTFAGLGIPLKQEFTFTLKRVPDPLSGNIILNALSKKVGTDLSKVVKVIDGVRTTAGLVQAGIQQAKAVVSTVQAVIGAPAAIIISELNKAARTGGSIKDLGNAATELLGLRPAVDLARTAAQTITAGLPTLVAQASASSVAIKAAVDTVITANGPVEGIIAAQAALVATNRLTRFASASYHSTKAAGTP